MIRVGILGGGQLARMLAEAASRLGLRPVVFSESRTSSAAQVCAHVVLGTTDSVAKLRKFFSAVDIVVFENEFVDCELIKRAAKGLSVRFLPGLEVIAQLQDKLTQKHLLTRLSIPTSPYLEMLPKEKPAAFVARALARFGGSCVIKWARLGYDGKGVMVVEQGEQDEATDFCREALRVGIPIYAEQRVRFVRELAQVSASNPATGDVQSYPLVISEQERGICKRVTGPASSLGVANELERAASEASRKLAKELQIAGCFAIEFFETDRGELWVNEIAPRVHNTGHFTQDAADTSQFENHWRGVLGYPLGQTRTAPYFAMLNLLGPQGVSRADADTALPVPGASIHLHWYGKDRLLPGRKLGHLNAAAPTRDALSRCLEQFDVCHEKWKTGMTRQAGSDIKSSRKSWGKSRGKKRVKK